MTYLPRPLPDIVNSQIVGYDLKNTKIDRIKFMYGDKAIQWYNKPNTFHSIFISNYGCKQSADSIADFISKIGIKNNLKSAILRIDVVAERYDIHDDEVNRYADMDIPTMDPVYNDNIKTFTYRISYNENSISVCYVEPGKLNKI